MPEYVTAATIRDAMRSARVERARARALECARDGVSVRVGAFDAHAGAFRCVARASVDGDVMFTFRSYALDTGARVDAESDGVALDVECDDDDDALACAIDHERGGCVFWFRKGATGTAAAAAAADGETADGWIADVIGDVVGGCASASVSLSGARVVTVSKEGAVTVLNEDFYPLSETRLTSDGGIVGASTSWRADGRFFAVSSTCEKTKVTTLRVFDGETAELESVGEGGDRATSGTPAALVGGDRDDPPPLAWQPRGALIACAGRSESDVSDRVIFYERNGLRRGDFAIPGRGTEISQLAWSCDSSRLAVVVRYADGGERALQIWTRSNMHWYLKHETRYDESEGTVRCEWDLESGDTIRAYTERGLMERLDLFWESTVSDRGTCAVIDGDAVLLTPMFRAPIPPPLCAAKVIFNAPVVAVAFQPATSSVERFVALLSTGELAQASSVQGADWERTADVFADSERAASWDRWTDNEIPAETLRSATGASSGVVVEHVAFVGDAHVAVSCTIDVDVHEIRLMPADVANDANQGVTKRATRESIGTLASANGVVFALARDSGDVYAVDYNDTASGGGEAFDDARRIERSSTVSKSDAKIIVARGLDACERYVDALGADSEEPRGALVTLDARGVLRVGDILVAENVTSFATHVFGADGCAVTSAEASEAVASLARDSSRWGEADDAPSTRLAYVTRDHRLYVAEVDDLIANGSRERRQVGDASADDAHVGNWLAERSAADGARMGEIALHSDLHQRMRRAMRPEAAKMAADASTRVVEEGAMIVACAPGATTVVLQMPRGNLETVAPKALVLPACACALRAGRYADAYALAAKQRVDLNLIVDYGWPKFLSVADDFVADINSPEAVMELLEALTESDVTAEGGIYEELARLYPPRATDGAGETATLAGGKSQAVCAAIRSAIERLGAAGDRWELAVLTSYASGDNPDLGSALKRVAVIRERELADAAANAMQVSSTKSRLTSIDAAAALKHLLFLVGAETLYNAALGTYDLSLAYLVAQHAQMDPGEYVAELETFQSMREHQRRASIALMLGRHEEAITECLLDGDVDGAASLASDQKMFPYALAEALRLQNVDARRALLIKFAEHLSRGSRHEDAAIARLAAEDVPGALESYRLGSCWQQALTLAGRLKMSAAERRNIAEELCESLAMTDPLAAARVAARHLQDAERAVELLCRSGAWREACETAYSDDRGDLLETTIAPMCAGAAQEHFESFKENKARAEKYSSRLRDLRKHRARAEQALTLEFANWSALGGCPNAGNDGDFEMDDAMSEAPSLASGMSAYTDRTGLTSAVSGTSAASTVGGRKAKRKKKDKKAKLGRGLRAGSPTEERDLALHVVALAPMSKTLEEIGELLEILVLFGHEDDARALQRVVGECVDAHVAATKDAETSLKELKDIALQKSEPTDAFERKDALGDAALEWKWSLLRAVGK